MEIKDIEIKKGNILLLAIDAFNWLSQNHMLTDGQGEKISDESDIIELAQEFAYSVASPYTSRQVKRSQL